MLGPRNVLSRDEEGGSHESNHLMSSSSMSLPVDTSPQHLPICLVCDTIQPDKTRHRLCLDGPFRGSSRILPALHIRVVAEAEEQMMRLVGVG